MPLTHSRSPAAFKANVATLMREAKAGTSSHVKSRDQALAIAYAIKRRGRAEGGAADDSVRGLLRDYVPSTENSAADLDSWTTGIGAPIANMVTYPGRAMQEGITTREAVPWAANTALAMVGTPGGAGGLGSGIRAYHGSPYDFDRFDMSKIGTGEGAQAYGHGLYFAENPEVARQYRENLGRSNALKGAAFNPDGTPNRAGWVAESLDAGIDEPTIREGFKIAHPELSQSQVDSFISEGRDIFNKADKAGRMYEVNINADPSSFLDWDRPLSEQPESVMQIAPNIPRSEYSPTFGDVPFAEPAGSEIYAKLAHNANVARSARDQLGGPYGHELAARQLADAGIPGIKYLDQGSRGAGEGTRNYVLFRDDIIDILRKYGLAGLPAAGAAAASAKSSQSSGDSGMANGGALDTAYRVKREGMAFGGQPPVPWQVRAEARGLMHTGPIPSIVPGRTDHHAISVPGSSYVLPADHVSSLGQGNTAAGMAILNKMFGGAGPYGVGKAPAMRPGRTMPRPPRAMGSDSGGSRGSQSVGAPVPIMAAGGEYVIPPHVVAAIGGGDHKRGHEILDGWVKSSRKQHINTLRKLPGPAKS